MPTTAPKVSLPQIANTAPIGTVVAAMILAFTPESIAQSEAEALVRYADALGRTGEAVIIGTEGLTIQGNTLQGAGILRPSAALSRAAELYAEEAGAGASIHSIEEALKIWDALEDYRTPIPYLRRYSKEKKLTNPEFATLCLALLAEYYEKQGDLGSAEKLLAPLKGKSSSSQVTAYARALYASYRIRSGDIDSAREIIDEVISNAPQTDFGTILRDGYTYALALQNEVPGLIKAGGTESTQEANLLVRAEGNPRLYHNLAIAAQAAGDKRKAIQYWGEFRKRFPTEAIARSGAIQSARFYEDLKEPDQAIEAYRGVLIQYPDYMQGAEAAVRAAELLSEGNRFKDALSLLEDATKRLKTAQGQAMVLAVRGKLYLLNGMADEAADAYMGLLIKYGDQDAARTASVSLRQLAPQVKNWRRFTDFIQKWLSGQYGSKGKVGNVQMSVADASQLRRLALGFYVEDFNASGGISWLKPLGMQSDARDRDWFIRDEAWFNGEITRKAVVQPGVRRQDLLNSAQLGLRAWDIAPHTEEGLGGLKAAQAILLSGKLDRAAVRQIVRQFEKYTSNGSEITQLLIPVYESIGEQKRAEELRQSAQL